MKHFIWVTLVILSELQIQAIPTAKKEGPFVEETGRENYDRKHTIPSRLISNFGETTEKQKITAKVFSATYFNVYSVRQTSINLEPKDFYAEADKKFKPRDFYAEIDKKFEPRDFYTEYSKVVTANKTDSFTGNIQFKSTNTALILTEEFLPQIYVFYDGKKLQVYPAESSSPIIVRIDSIEEINKNDWLINLSFARKKNAVPQNDIDLQVSIENEKDLALNIKNRVCDPRDTSEFFIEGEVLYSGFWKWYEIEKFDFQLANQGCGAGITTHLTDLALPPNTDIAVRYRLIKNGPLFGQMPSQSEIVKLNRGKKTMFSPKSLVLVAAAIGSFFLYTCYQ